MSFKEEDRDGAKIIHLEGDIDLEQTDVVRKTLSEAVEKNDTVHANMANVSYIDSSGVSVLIEVNQKAGDAGKTFALEKISEQVSSVLQMAKLDSFFTIKD